MYRFLALLLMFSLLGCTTDAPVMEEKLREWRTQYAPDKRTDRVAVELENGVLKGYTTVAEAYDSLRALGLPEEVRLLPDTAVGNLGAGIIKVSVANLRSEPGHSQELATQALLGTPIQLLDRRGDWFLVRTPDRYLAWLEGGAFARMTPAAAQEWLAGDLRLYLGPAGEITTGAGEGLPLSDIVAGGLVTFAEEQTAAYVSVQLPDGQTGWLPREYLLWPPEWLGGIASAQTGENLLLAADWYRGRPYLWGGTSPKGMDCSGFTKTVYYLNGYVIPRDASQQVHAGTPVELTDDFVNLLPGDLLFFGRYRDDGSEKITHVGFYLGNGRFLHSGADNGRIAENSLIPGDALFVEQRLQSLLRAKRLQPGSEGVIAVGEAFTGVLE